MNGKCQEPYCDCPEEHLLRRMMGGRLLYRGVCGVCLPDWLLQGWREEVDA